MSLKVTILGCGSSGGVPRIGGNWGECDPTNLKNRRRRCSILVQQQAPSGTTNVLVDTSPDIRTQLLDTNVSWLDGVLYTHEHADHIHGIDDLRAIAINGRERVNVYADKTTLKTLTERFGYCFKAPSGSAYPPILKEHLITPGEPITITGEGGEISATAFEQVHGRIMSIGYRFNELAYSSDLNDLPDASLDALQGLDIWIVDALKRTPHPTHFSLQETLQWIERINPKRAILTNMHIDMDYETLISELPDNVVPAYDGMEIEI